MLDKVFKLKEANTTVSRELVAALTTFVSLSYILFVNPNILHAAGIPAGAAFTVTAIATAVGCFIMGLVANYPIALAPTLGSGAFFAYNVCVGMHIKWQTALASVLVASILFVLITALHLRELVVDAIPQDLKYAISAGIGLFIAFIGLQNGKLIVNSDSSLVTLGKFSSPAVWISLFGLLITVILMAMNVPGSIFIGMIITAIFGIAIGQIPLPHGFISTPPSIAPTFGQAVLHLKDINTPQLFMVVLTFLLVTFFDTAGTLIGMTEQAGLVDANGKIPRIGRAFAADSTAMIEGAVLGTAPLGTSVESSAGIAMGGKTGLTAMFIGIFFLISMIFSPLLAVIPTTVTAPALIIVGVLMASNLKKIDWDKFEVAFPAFLIVVGMPLTYSISDGLALGMIAYPITMLATKRYKEVSVMMYILFFIFIGFFLITNL
ncbi:NCS2 family permease [Lactobacillus gigeriorum]|uniref:NCS2 family nucleobase cation symporter-2 n=1 Tax=Lactobacillus gigeriorum DSM 23908 = CRBIP 24.85 TaxID=1423751 RepID=I7LFM7_9LACO|nr:NCS2 family permease [Lactobacillus gigeriorum]KRN14035.1 NCS2 family nucleobase cation symporter-2 [Lactobacillus gigeriorum DSM 23908 = CRBIP 24.85]CCI86803.1 NCS2 family nucleobase:cation symporter-2 [Lactobacillus gigeriorum DSM 23908 = CRBIP 24.85]